MRKTEFCLFILISLLLLIPVSMMAGEDESVSSSDLELQISSRPEMKVQFNQTFTLPFLRRQHPLTADNNIKFSLGGYFTPISIATVGEVGWTPVAFLILSGGAQAASGWNVFLGNGLSIVEPVGDKTLGVERSAATPDIAFEGLVWRVLGAGTLQFNLAAVIPGDWTHVIFQTRHEFRYSAYTRAAANEPWVFENDDGENINGWRYYATFILGYRMPLSPVLKMIAVMAELDKKLYYTPGGDYWGESLGTWFLSIFGVFNITQNINVTFALQTRTRRNNDYIQFVDNNDHYYQDIELIDIGGPRRLVFYRVALIINYRLR